MRFIFVFTNSASPKTDVILNVTSITPQVLNNRDCVYVVGEREGTAGTYIFYKDSGIPAVLWE